MNDESGERDIGLEYLEKLLGALLHACEELRASHLGLAERVQANSESITQFSQLLNALQREDSSQHLTEIERRLASLEELNSQNDQAVQRVLQQLRQLSQSLRQH